MANQVTLFRTEKGKEGLGYMGHVYRFGKRGLGGNIYWRLSLPNIQTVLHNTRNV
jgi:hypothetical protein